MADSTEALEIISYCASIPSFSSFEEHLHPYIEKLVGRVPGAEMQIIPHNNLLIKVPGKEGSRPVALCAHLDKINHFGEETPSVLPVDINNEYIEGLLDDATGLGICLSLMLQSKSRTFPPLYLFLSEMEESYGLKNHPELLKNGGKDLHHGMGAESISRYVIEKEQVPSIIITVDTTPLFKGEPGIALYARHWELNGMEPSDSLITDTMDTVKQMVAIEPGLLVTNNTNDYLVYGKYFNSNPDKPIPSLAIEPAICPYHQKNERVFVKDILRVEQVLISFLGQRV